MLAGAAQRLLDRVARELAAPPKAILDVGTGAGLLALAAAERWPDARVIGLDASEAMLSLARRRSAERWPGEPSRIEWRAADAAALSLDEASVDLVLSSFMLQLVADRQAVLQEMRRALRPGGLLGLVTWLADDAALPADLEFDEAVLDLGLDEDGADEADPGEGEYADVTAARAELEACGFWAVDAQLDRLEHAWSRQGYAAFKEGFDEWELFSSLDAADLERLRRRVAERWAGLSDAAFALDAPLVSIVARRGS